MATTSAMLDVVQQVILLSPVPFLQPAVQSFKLIWDQVLQARVNKRQIQAIAQTVAQMLMALNSQAMASSRPGIWEDEKWMQKNSQEFETLLSDIAAFCTKVSKKKFIKSFLDSSNDQAQIDSLNSRLKMSVAAFQISSQIGFQNYSLQVEAARQEDQAEINAVLQQLLEKQDMVLSLVGQPVASTSQDVNINVTNDKDTKVTPVDSQATIFSMLREIQISVKEVAESTKPEPPQQPAVDQNPILAHLKQGLKPDVLIGPIQWRMKDYTWDRGICYCITSEQTYDFERSEDSSKLFIEYLISSDDRPLQYAALDKFRRDKAVKHFFKKEDVYVESDHPNPLLANLKPGLSLSVVIPPIKYKMNDYTWKGSIASLVTSEQQGSFFCNGEEGCKRYIEYLQNSDDVALQYATLEVFRQNPSINFFFVAEPKED